MTVRLFAHADYLDRQGRKSLAAELRETLVIASAANMLQFAFVPYSSINLRWNEDGSIQCSHVGNYTCDLGEHKTIPTWVRPGDLERQECDCDDCSFERTFG